MTHPLFELWLKDTFRESEISDVQKNAAREAFNLLYPEILEKDRELEAANTTIRHLITLSKPVRVRGKTNGRSLIKP